MILGVIADDFTGATDVASMLVRAGMHTVQVLGVPDGGLPAADAVVIALKTRTIAPADAVAHSLAALAALRAAKPATSAMRSRMPTSPFPPAASTSALLSPVLTRRLPQRSESA